MRARNHERPSSFARGGGLAGLGGIVVLAGLLEVAVRIGLVSEHVVPPPSAIAAGFVALARDEGVGWPFALTIGQAVVATLLGASVGLPIGTLLWLKPPLKRAFEPWLGAFFAAPLVLLYPLFLVVFGRGYATSIVVGAIMASIAIALKTREGLSAVPPVLINVGRSFRLRGMGLFAKVIFPAAAPTIFTGFRLGLIYALVNIIGIEFLTDFGGLGRVVSDTFFKFQIPEMWAAIVLIVLASTLVLSALKGAERWLRPA